MLLKIVKLHFSEEKLSLSSPEDFFHCCEREGERERQRERTQPEKESNCLSESTPIEPETWVCALIRHRTHDLLVYGMMLLLAEPQRPGLKENLVIISSEGLYIPLKNVACWAQEIIFSFLSKVTET